MPECGKYIGKGLVNFPCTVDTPEGSNHAGPCAAQELPQTVRERQRWLSQELRDSVPKSHLVPVSLPERPSDPEIESEPIEWETHLPPVSDEELATIVAIELRLLATEAEISPRLPRGANPFLWMIYERTLGMVMGLRRYIYDNTLD